MPLIEPTSTRRFRIRGFTGREVFQWTGSHTGCTLPKYVTRHCVRLRRISVTYKLHVIYTLHIYATRSIGTGMEDRLRAAILRPQDFPIKQSTALKQPES